jgi:hypothetical protein
MTEKLLYKIEQPSLLSLIVILTILLLVALFFIHGIYSNLIYLKECHFDEGKIDNSLCIRTHDVNKYTGIIGLFIMFPVSICAALLAIISAYNITGRFLIKNPLLIFYENSIKYHNIFAHKPKSISINNIEDIHKSDRLIVIKLRQNTFRRLVFLFGIKLNDDDLIKINSILEDYKKLNI